jgi:hypothetical protein
MSCVNPNDPLFKILLKEIKNPLLAEIEFDKQQDYKPGVEELFDSNPELASIGTEEQYSQYLDTIFPDSKVKDIVYRGGEKKDTSLFEYFTNNYAEAYMYSKANVTKGGKITERNPISVIKNNIAKTYNLNKNVLLAITDTQLGVNGLEYEGFISKEDADEARKLLSTNKDIKNLSRLIELYSIVSIESEEDLMKQFDNTEYQKYKPEYDKIRKELEPFFNRKDVGEIKTAILNIKNPYKGEIVQEDLQNDRDAYKNGHDGAFLMDGDHFLVKNNTEQIHILGNEQDIEGFKEFVGKEEVVGNINETDEELDSYISDQLVNKLGISIPNKNNETLIPQGDVDNFNNAVAMNGNIQPSVYYTGINDVHKWRLNQKNLYDLIDKNTGDVYIKNVNLSKGIQEKEEVSYSPINTTERDNMIDSINQAVNDYRLDEILAEKGYDVNDIISNLEAASTQEELNDIINKLLNKIC